MIIHLVMDLPSEWGNQPVLDLRTDKWFLGLSEGVNLIMKHSPMYIGQ